MVNRDDVKSGQQAPESDDGDAREAMAENKHLKDKLIDIEKENAEFLKELADIE